MGNVVAYESVESKLNAELETELKRLRAADPFQLPERTANLTNLYVKKIQGKYDVTRAKKDTDSAIDLLYIAYNTTPQTHSEIRTQISAIMDGLENAQRESKEAMRNAMLTADDILREIRLPLADWVAIRKCKDPEDKDGVAELKEFFKTDIIELAARIKARALEIKKDLDAIVAKYDAIIRETSAATAKSEAALATGLKRQEAIANEINETNARREQLEAMVTDLQAEVAKYDKMAKDFEARANTAEERAFIMSIVQVGAQMLAAAIPAIVTAVTASATGGASVVAAAAASTVKHAIGEKNAEAPADKATDAQVIDTKKKISDKQAEAKASRAKIEEMKTNLKTLENEVVDAKKRAKKKPEQTTPAAAADKEKDKPKPKPPAEDADDQTVAALEKRIKTDTKALTQEEEKYAGLVGVLSGLQASLAALDKGLGKLTETQQNEVASLRVLQMKMLDKVEAYEKERRNQNAELVKINALLVGKRTDQQTTELTIKSLNLSITALKRAKEVVQGLATFFQSFAAFMDGVSRGAENDMRMFERFSKSASVRGLLEVMQTGDNFLSGQTGTWHGVHQITERFATAFENGMSKVQALNGKYIHGPELETYLKAASVQIEQIVAERDQASKQRLIDLEGYRKEMLAAAS